MAKCDNPNPGSSKNTGCGQPKDHQGDHTNGFSWWTQGQGKGGKK